MKYVKWTVGVVVYFGIIVALTFVPLPLRFVLLIVWGGIWGWKLTKFVKWANRG